MYRGDNDVEPREHLVGEVERAVRLYLHLCAVQYAEISANAAPRLFNLAPLLVQSLYAQPVRDRQAAAVVGDGDVLIAALLRRPRHIEHAHCAIAPCCVAVQVALDIAYL